MSKILAKMLNYNVLGVIGVATFHKKNAPFGFAFSKKMDSFILFTPKGRNTLGQAIILSR
jgi:hypothetical protein